MSWRLAWAKAKLSQKVKKNSLGYIEMTLLKQKHQSQSKKKQKEKQSFKN